MPLGSRYENELKPFLPIAGADLFLDTRAEREQKSLNLALFDNIIRDPQTGDANVNPLQFGLVLQDAWRFSGDNRVFDFVMPGGSLNMGSLPVGTERYTIPDNDLAACHAKIVSHRQVKQRFTRTNDYLAALHAAACSVMPAQQMDIQWTNNNKSNKDMQHATYANNTMPIEPEWWTQRRQVEGDVPLQDNLLPAQALFPTKQLGLQNKTPSHTYNVTARMDPTYNPTTRFGWQPGVAFA